MLTTHRGMPHLMGPSFQLMGAGEIETLQRSLINLSVATARPAINCKITGIMDDQTMVALSSAVGLLSEELPSWAYLGLQAVMAGGSTSSTAKKYAGEYASQLAIACNTAAIKFKATPTAPVVAPTTTVGFFAPGWYKTPFGLLLIAGVAFLGYKFILAPTPKA